ncbi:fumarylacetoacetase [Tothia fuscella]|uniref:Fumarylacetoacetase n=1 Tax=Tothia fuscella TaxID=1048955 RepID=A0A9P4TX61_9PEZI|nr:fumarylacetoacetase [Tothia fuscella]
MASWISVHDNSDFSLHNLPYGVFSVNRSRPRIGVAIGGYVLDLKVIAQDQILGDLEFNTQTLEEKDSNAYAALGKDVHTRVRKRLHQLLEAETTLGSVLRDHQDRRNRSLVLLSNVTMHLPVKIGDNTDFFVGLHHAENVCGPIDGSAEICPSFFDMPIAYHGRSSSVVISATPVHRPKGQFVEDGKPVSAPCRQLDFEVELALVVGQGSKMGSSIDVKEAEDHIFGVVLMNDWSARDIQLWESTVLGPFNGKNFCTTISPWIVPLEALEPFRTAPSKPDRELLAYLTQKEVESAYDIPIQVTTFEVNNEKYDAGKCNTNNVIFSLAQMLTHHTRGGCPLRPGDLIATGTLSGPTQSELGCLMEATRHGTESYEMQAMSSSKGKISRKYLENGDIIEFTAQARGKDGLGNVGFGKCSGKVLAAI